VEDAHVIDWQLPDYLAAEVSGNQQQVFLNPAAIALPEEAKGLIQFSVTVTDSGAESLAQTKYFSLPLLDKQPRLTSSDTDRDGLTDVSEGYADTDNDGLPAFMDTSFIPYLQPLHVNSAVVKLMETEPGLHLVLGKYARLQYSDGVQMSQQEIDDTGLISADDLVHKGGYFDFEIHDIQPFGRSVFVVIPLQQALEKYAVYRKFTSTNKWQDFVINNNNALASSIAINGVCPAPHSELYEDGLVIGNVCLRVLIEDGGVNDADGIANGVVEDPAGIAVVSNKEITKETDPEKSSSGSLSFFFIFVLGLIFISRQHQAVNTVGKRI